MKGQRQQRQQTKPKPIEGCNAHSCSSRSAHTDQLKSIISSPLALVGSWQATTRRQHGGYRISVQRQVLLRKDGNVRPAKYMFWLCLAPSSSSNGTTTASPHHSPAAQDGSHSIATSNCHIYPITLLIKIRLGLI